MKIELKNFKHAAFSSRGTACFTATVYVDNVKTFIASNSGQGECSSFHPVDGKTVENIHQVERWIESQPKIKLMDEFEVFDNLDYFIARLVDRQIESTRLKRLLKKHVVIYDPMSHAPSPKACALMEFASSFKPSGLNDKQRDSLEKIYTGCLILNDLEIDLALDMFLASNVPEKMTAVYRQIKEKLKAA
jgi:hypothetical protein